MQRFFHRRVLPVSALGLHTHNPGDTEEHLVNYRILPGNGHIKAFENHTILGKRKRMNSTAHGKKKGKK